MDDKEYDGTGVDITVYIGQSLVELNVHKGGDVISRGDFG